MVLLKLVMELLHMLMCIRTGIFSVTILARIIALRYLSVVYCLMVYSSCLSSYFFLQNSDKSLKKIIKLFRYNTGVFDIELFNTVADIAVFLFSIWMLCFTRWKSGFRLCISLGYSRILTSHIVLYLPDSNLKIASCMLVF